MEWIAWASVFRGDLCLERVPGTGLLGGMHDSVFGSRRPRKGRVMGRIGGKHAVLEVFSVATMTLATSRIALVRHGAYRHWIYGLGVGRAVCRAKAKTSYAW